MRISYDEFEHCCRECAAREEWKREGWTVNIKNNEVFLQKKNHVRKGCVGTRTRRSKTSPEESATIDINTSVIIAENDDDTIVSIPQPYDNGDDNDDNKNNNNNRFYTFEYHAVYSHAYNVPMLYYNAYELDTGLALTDREVMMEFMNPTLKPNHNNSNTLTTTGTDSGSSTLESSSWTFVTQGEHPLLGEVFFYLHPCQTAELMDTVVLINHNNNTKDGAASSSPSSATTPFNYVASWLSFFAPVIGLHLPFALFTNNNSSSSSSNNTNCD